MPDGPGAHQTAPGGYNRGMPPAPRLPRAFFARRTLTVARQLLGQRLIRLEQDGSRTAGLILETEAYVGTEDLGCHAKAGRTARNQAMWGPPGHAYVYFTYGMHWMLNFVTEEDGFPAAVLIRAVLPTEGHARIRRRRRGQPAGHWTDGPAKLCSALGIDQRLNGHDLCSPSAHLFLEARPAIADDFVTIGLRVGLTNVPEPWKSKPWRFLIRPERAVLLAKEARR